MATRIRELREEYKMSQIRLSIELEVSQEAVSAYENDKNFPSVPLLIKMSELFNASVDYILGISDIRIAIDSDNLTNDKKNLLMGYMDSLIEN